MINRNTQDHSTGLKSQADTRDYFFGQGRVAKAVVGFSRRILRSAGYLAGMDERLAETGLRAAALRGDAEAWRALYERAEADLARYALWRCGRHDLAEDVVQAAWLAAARGLKKFDPARGSFRTWLFNLAADAAGKQLRSDVRSTRRVLVLASQMHSAPDRDEADAERVALALAALSPEHEAVLRAKYFEDKSVDEIAAENRETTKAVESRLSRARESFRRAYETEST